MQANVISPAIAIYRDLAQTPFCDHFPGPCYPVRGCRWCEMSDQLDRHENCEARRLGEPEPNVIAGRERRAVTRS